MSSRVRIATRAARADDAAAIAAIYNQGIAGRQATFETRPREPHEILAWLDDGRPLLVAAGAAVLGWGRIGAYSPRKAYRGIGEYSVYVDADARGTGIGRTLLTALCAEAERGGLHKLTARILAGNAASLALARACGFDEVGTLRRQARLDGEWRDCVLVERLLGDAR